MGHYVFGVLSHCILNNKPYLRILLIIIKQLLMSNTRLMVVGFLFANNQVLLIEKQRPAKYTGAGRPVEQAGFLNGIGGVVAPGETAIDCLIRKCPVETGITTVASQWIPFHELQGGDATIIFCKAVLTPKQLSSACSPTDEHVGLYDIDRIFNQKVLPNIHWLVAMACDETHKYSVSMGYAYEGDTRHTDIINFLSTPLLSTPESAAGMSVALKTDAANGPAIADREGFISEFREVLEAEGFMPISTVETMARKYNVPVPPPDIMLAFMVKGDTPQEYEATSNGIALIKAASNTGSTSTDGQGSVTGGAEKTSEGGSLETATRSEPSAETTAKAVENSGSASTASTPAPQEASTPAPAEPVVKTSKK